MIKYIDNDFDLNDLVGKIIFHATKGGSAIFRGPLVTNPTNIGCRLGEVVDVSGSNRIYYNDEHGDKKYVSTAVIGCYCDTDKDASDLDALVEKYNEKARILIDSLASDLSNEISEIKDAN